jgi:hypothetical protein
VDILDELESGHHTHGISGTPLTPVWVWLLAVGDETRLPSPIEREYRRQWPGVEQRPTTAAEAFECLLRKLPADKFEN